MSNKIWFVVVMNLAAGGAAADPCGEIDDMDAQLACFDRYARCVSIASDAERLACYQEAPSSVTGIRTQSSELPESDAVVEPATKPPATPVAKSAVDAVPAASVTPTAEPTGNTSVEKVEADDAVFPVRGRASPPEQAPAQISAAITRVRTNPQEIVYLYLDNGQVWKETARSRFRYKVGQRVTISAGSFGSTNLHAEGMRKYAKVVRVN